MSNAAPTPGDRNSPTGTDGPGNQAPKAPGTSTPGTSTPGVPASDASTRRERSGKPGRAAKQPKAAKPYKSSDDWGVFRAVVIGVGILVAGFGLYNLITGTAGLPDSSGGEVDPTLESQYRFFAAMMVGVGAAFVAIAVKFQWANMLWLVCLMVFLGGIGRVLSWAFSGTPHFTFIVLMIVELAFPPALLVWHRFIAKTSDLRREYSQQAGGDAGIAGGSR
ncbi:DUF4345 domain-containing protein [Arthrobacter sp. zg-Y1171]|uniref:DUF4345 domain-containing protein n=1 Tax=Arthrobacter sp. zg-Y1171 TaxID=2964610 RepID=UPI0021054DFF|nr:DUF4345 domain-containing protein [Arthrobacter sp. zg-Y1171]MCQ1996079.1 DUF4345 domain-containing protein [Arthrobacter sp. zg-Y1171]UWX82853.1 DUF4345 domain-containing protein [Arthrobacter sp. zg-Y1171]